jgi:hypothetical protein
MMRLLIGLVLAALCMFPSTASAIMVFPTTFYSAAAAAGTYSANAVRFDGSNDYLSRGSGLDSDSDGKTGTISVWVNFKSGDGVRQFIFSSTGNRLRLDRESNNTFLLQTKNSATSNILSMASSSTYTVSDGWVHFLASWNLATPVAYLYINDSDDEAGGTTETDDTIDNTITEHIVGADADGGEKLNADMADLYISREFIDITQQDNRLKFRSDAGKPVSMGDDCSEVTGESPIVCFTNPTATWHTNVGSGGGFTENGALTDAADSPSD